MKIFNGINWKTVFAAVAIMYLVWQVDDAKDFFTTKNKFFK